MADDQKTKTMDINDLVRELSKSSTSPVVPTPPMPTGRQGLAPAPQAPRPSFPTPKPPMPPPMTGSVPASFAPRPTVPSTLSPSAPSGGGGTTPIYPSQTKPPETSKPQFNTPLPSSGVKEYQSSIRTMNEDISKLKQGQQPMGVPVPRKVEQVVPTPQPIPLKPVVPGPQFKVPSVNLGETQKSAPMAPSKTVPGVSIPKIPSAPQIYVPQEGKGGDNRNKLFVGIGAVVVVAGFAYWFFMLRLPAPEVVIETPTPTPTETPTPLPFEKLAIAETISISSTGTFLESLTAEMNVRQPNAGQIRLFNIVDEDRIKYDFKEFLTKLLVDTSTLDDSGILDTTEWVFGLYGQVGTGQDFSSRPFLVVTQDNSAVTNSAMNTWEPKIINDLAGLFNLSNPSSSLVFTSDFYSGIDFRFVRIPDRDLGVAYAVFQNYLVFGSSRDSFRAILDALITP